jgi:hypothetical protein
MICPGSGVLGSSRVAVHTRVAVARDNKLTGAAGEHHVCSELARRNWAPSLTRDGLARTDILAVHTETRVMIEVQVKTSSKALSWPLGHKGTIASISEREWYVFVCLNELPTQPRCWVVPRDHVAAATWIGHMSWLTDSSAKAGSRNVGIDRARISADTWERYEDRWHLLQEPATSAPGSRLAIGRCLSQLAHLLLRRPEATAGPTPLVGGDHREVRLAL